MKKIFFFGILVLLTVLIFIACEGPMEPQEEAETQTAIIIDDNTITDDNIKVYLIAFNANGGIPAPESLITMAEGSSVSEPQAMTKNGYSFGGWYIDSDLSFRAVFPFIVTGNSSLSAKWNEIPGFTFYSVRFISNMGTQVADQRVAENSKAAVPLNPVKSGYTFDGWYSDMDLSIAYDFNKPVLANTVLYAKWIYSAGLPIINVNELELYLSAQKSGKTEADPVYLSLSIRLTGVNWLAILEVLAKEKKYVILDLCACTRSEINSGIGLRSDGTFDQGCDIRAYKIVSLIVPNDAKIAATFSNLSANGTETEAATSLTLVFDKDISALNADDITIIPDSIEKGEFIKTGYGIYELEISGALEIKQITAAVSKNGYVISPASRSIYLDFSIPILLISQIYGAGGNTGALYTHDFIELRNNGFETVDLGQFAIQYASATGSFSSSSNIIFLSGTILSGGYFLIQCSGGTNGVPLPVAADLVCNVNLAASAGKLALIVNDQFLTGYNPDDPWKPGVIDFAGYGNANQSRGNPAPAPSNILAVFRKENGSMDTGDNALDFETRTPDPRNSSSPIFLPES